MGVGSVFFHHSCSILPQDSSSTLSGDDTFPGAGGQPLPTGVDFVEARWMDGAGMGYG